MPLTRGRSVRSDGLFHRDSFEAGSFGSRPRLLSSARPGSQPYLRPSGLRTSVLRWGPRRNSRRCSAWSPFSNGPRLANLVREVLEVMMTTGTIKKVVADRGFGFIAAEYSKEYFFQRDGLDSSLDFDRLTGGERVEFEIEQSPKGPRASKVRAA